MPRTENLRLLIDQFDAEPLDVNDEFNYIGTGNPNANNLIIGKEAAIASDVLPDQYK